MILSHINLNQEGQNLHFVLRKLYVLCKTDTNAQCLYQFVNVNIDLGSMDPIYYDMRNGIHRIIAKINILNIDLCYINNCDRVSTIFLIISLHNSVTYINCVVIKKKRTIRDLVHTPDQG